MSAVTQERRMTNALPMPDSDSLAESTSDLRVSRYFVWKGVLDRAVALVLLIPGLPMIGLLVLLVRTTSRGPGIYRQVRVGRGGRHYTMFKMRSMRVDAESGTGAVWAKQGDARVTRVGYWLRKLHLDELPQLFNVLCGEMSLIGPRPERPEFVKTLGREIPGYLSRLDVPPGITGLAQINLPPDRDLDDVRRKIVLDREYIESATLLFDFRIFLCTLLRIVGVRGESAMRVMGLQRTVVLPPAQSTASLEETVHDLPTNKTSTIVTVCETHRDVRECSPNMSSFAAAESR
jgi:lipopolysaccharide/colanic/teichoic acid biosynthesis glycosyltransferase